MHNALVAFLMLICIIDARAQRSVTATIQNVNRTGTDFSFDLYARSTGTPQINLGWSSFFFYYNSNALAAPTLMNINPKFTGDSLTADYAPMRVSIVNSTPPRLGIQVFYSGRGANTGQQLSTAAPNGELICTVRLAITDGSANSDLRWDAGSSNANTWILSKDMLQVENAIDGVGSSTNDVAVGNGWNIVSVPVVAVDMQSATLFPGASSPAYGYNNGYFTADQLSTTKGYWIKFGAVDTFTVFGTRVSPSTIPVVAGWNIVGPLEFHARTAAITSTPSGIIATPFYGYSNGYIVADTIKRGRGYWVKTTQAGTLNLAGAVAKIGASNAIIVDNWIHIELEDNAGLRGTLYLAKAEELHGSFELPPPGPSGMFDVRYTSNTIAEPLNSTAHQVQLNSVAYPLRIKAINLNGLTLRVKDMIGGSVLDGVLRDGNELIVTQNLNRIEILEVGTISKQLPTVYELNQNYPNPFNPTTVIKFALPKDSHVSMSVYNVLGQTMRDVVNADYAAGYHQIEFNAAAFASGMYLYKLVAGDFVQTRKMLILK